MRLALNSADNKEARIPPLCAALRFFLIKSDKRFISGRWTLHLYLIQPSGAKSEQEDPSRPLSEKGRRDAQKVAGFLSANTGLGMENIFHSGKLRAQETAAIFAGHVPPAHGLTKAEGLAPLDDPSQWTKKLGETEGDTMVVGHMPYLGRLASLLLCGKAEGNPHNTRPRQRLRVEGKVCYNRPSRSCAVSWTKQNSRTGSTRQNVYLFFAGWLHMSEFTRSLKKPVGANTLWRTRRRTSCLFRRGATL